MTKAERDRFNALPFWAQRAEILQRDAVKASDDQTYEQILGRLKAEDRAAQQLAAGPGRPILGERYADDPVRKEMEKRARAEAAVSQQQRHSVIEEQFAVAKARYRALMADFERGDPEAVKLMNTHDYTSFGRWFEDWKQGKVR